MFCFKSQQTLLTHHYHVRMRRYTTFYEDMTKKTQNIENPVTSIRAMYFHLNVQKRQISIRPLKNGSSVFVLSVVWKTLVNVVFIQKPYIVNKRWYKLNGKKCPAWGYLSFLITFRNCSYFLPDMCKSWKHGRLR